jgi:hypothetical protein
MRNRVLFFTAALLWCCMSVMPSGKLLAQTPAEKLQSLSQTLNLTSQQKVEMLPILKQEAPKLEAIKNNPSLTGPQKVMQLRAIHQQTDPQVKAILSPQQYKEWQTIRQREIDEAIQRKMQGPE